MQGEEHPPLHPAGRLVRCMGVNGALRRVLTRSVLACGSAPLRLAHPPLTPTTRETASASCHAPGCRTIGFARKLPVQERHGHHAAPAQVADKANAASVPQGIYAHRPQSPLSFTKHRQVEMGRHCTPQ